MTSLTRWDLFRELDDLQTRLSTMFGRSPVRKDGERREAMTVAEWAPLVDITEDDTEYAIKAELPEVKKEDIKLTVDDDVLRIMGERKFQKEEKAKKYHRVERAYGSFTKSFTLPENTDPGRVRAEFKDGVLNIRLLKSAKTKPKAIEVSVS